ncbi:hypothetical protein BKA62DRAFT_619360 [Auriculariales sp. MPI-PUGE-AT-0066]|nr:hypothetical protein BKA62DRAFT_619360 [Auriculariales sp. MPI-PUGE-AT-0066]
MSSSPTSSHRKRPSLSQRFSWSRRPSRNVLEPAEDEKPVAVLRIQIIGCKELRAADINGKSDPYVAVTVARQRQKTPVSPKTLAPTYDPKSATFDFPLYATVLQKVGSLLELVVWDKDVIGKDYLGELAVPAGEWFAHNGGIKPFASPGNKVRDFWLPLVSTRAPGRAERESKGQVHLKLGFINAPGTADTNFDDIFNTYFLSGRSLLSVSPTQGFATLGENAVVNADDGSDGADEPGSPHSPRLSQDSRRTLSMKLPSFRLNWSDTKIDYSFGTHNDVEGVLLLEIKDASNLPKLGGGLSKLVGGSWDMDPFVMVHTNHKAFRTRVVRHSLNPEWNEKIMFHVRKSDLNEDTKIHLTVRDWDKITSDDYVGDAAIDLVDLIGCGKTEISLDEAIQSLEESIGSRLDHNQQPSWAHITEKTKPAEPTILVTAPSSVKRDVAPQVDAASTQLVIQQAALPAPSAPSEPVVGPQHVSESKDYASTPEGTDIDATHLQPEESAPSETSEQSVPVLHDADQAPEHVEPTTCSSTKAQVEKPSTHAIFEISGCVVSFCSQTSELIGLLDSSRHAITHWGEHVYVVGSLIELGSWNPMKAIKLSSDEYPIWKASVQLPVDTPFEYKYIRIVPGQQVFWEETPFVNRDARTPVVGTFEVHDAWY